MTGLNRALSEVINFLGQVLRVCLVAYTIWFMYGIVQNNNDPFFWLDELYQPIQDEAISLNTLFY